MRNQTFQPFWYWPLVLLHWEGSGGITLCFRTILREVFRVKSDDEIGLALFRAETEWIIFWVMGYLDSGTNLDLVGSFGNPQKMNVLADISRFSCLFIDRGLFSRFPLARTRKPGRGRH
jgi:hypothetical protein